MHWDVEALSEPPRTYDAPGFEAEGVRGLFYEGLPWRGRPTRVFAWYGAPPGGGPFPGMVLVHGGGGTAFAEWVRRWTARGYAAIAMDTCGATAGGEHLKRPRHAWGGPPGCGGFDQIDEPVADQWMYHAVADVLLGASLLAAQGEVDAQRIGLTGISWGAILGCVAAGIDRRLRLAAPVYGCGFLGRWTDWPQGLKGTDPDRAKRWLETWDPRRFLPAATAPMLWVTGTNDFPFPLSAFQASYRLPRGPRTLCVRVGMKHGHEEGCAPPEIGAFADSVLGGGAPLARVTGQGADGGRAWATFSAECPVTRAEFCFTRDRGAWAERRWQTVPAELEAAEGDAARREARGSRGRTAASVPEGAAVYYLNLVDERGLMVSTEHVEAPA